MKKFLAILLTVCLLAGMFTFAASANSEPLDVAGATILSDAYIALHFTEAVSCENFNGPYYIAALKKVGELTTAFKGNEGACARIGLTYAGISSDKKTVYISCGGGLEAMYNRTGAYAAYAGDNNYEMVVGVDGYGLEGQPYVIKSFDGSKSLRSLGTIVHPGLATLPYNASANVTFDASWKQSEHPLTMVGATILNEKDVLIEFSEPISVTVNAWGGYGAWIIGYEDADGNRQCRTGIGADFVSNDGRYVKVTVNNAQDWLNATGAYAAYAGMTPIIGVDSVQGQWATGYTGGIDSVHPASNPAVNMKPTKQFLNGGGGEGLWCAYTSDIVVDEDYLYPDPTEDDLRLVSATIINDTQLMAQLSEAFTVLEPWTVTYKMVYLDANNSITETYYMGAEVVGGSLKLTLAGTDKTMPEILEDEAHANDTLWFVIEEVLDRGDKLDGGVEKIEAAATPGKQLAATVVNLQGADSAWVPVDVDYDFMLPMDQDTTGKFSVVSATAINDKQIYVRFSEPVHMEAPYAYIAFRYTDIAGYLAVEDGVPLQLDGKAVMSGDGMGLTWTINETGNLEGCKNVIEAVTRTGAMAKYAKYYPMMCFEEICDPDTNGTISHVFNDNGEELTANRVYDIGRDASYTQVKLDTEFEIPELLPLEIPEMKGDGPKIVKAVAANERQIVITFSEPVTFVDPYGFIALRYVDKNFNLGFDGETPLQFYGGAVVSLDRKSVVWTLADKGNIGDVQNVLDIINRTGSLAKYKNYYPVMGIEEIIDGKDKDSYIENIVSDSGKKLIANCPTDAGRDRVYVNIDVDFKFKVPETSDNTNILLLCVGIIIPVAVAGTLLIKRRKFFA